MKRKILLVLVMSSCITALSAQKKQQKEQQPVGYAITAMEKGGRSWKEVRQVNLSTGAELRSIYQSSSTVVPLNARTGKPVERKESALFKTVENLRPKVGGDKMEKKVVNLDEALNNENRIKEVRIYTDKQDVSTYVRVVREPQTSHGRYQQVQRDAPFATNSAAMAYDKKHERLYYTPMGINELRYIDLKSDKIYYFENEPFGKLAGMGDLPNQITRMVIASDGNGYALTNDGRNLIRFTTGKETVITQLGELTDEAPDAKQSIHSRNGYGGDMVADAAGNLYLITANRNVFKISIASRTAKWLGTIQGLPPGFSTNGAMVESGSKVIVASSESTLGYFRFDLNTLQAEKISAEGEVFNASDLANGNLAFEKEKKKKDRKAAEQKEESKPVEPVVIAKEMPVPENKVDGIMVYPNPVSAAGVVNVSFENQPAGVYQVQVMDLGGKLISSQQVTVENRLQVAALKLPGLLSGSTYVVRVFNEANRISSLSKLVVQ